MLQVDPASVVGNLRVAVRLVPELGGVQLLRTWPAIVNGTPDWRPILGEVPRVRGFHMCVVPWLGFTGGPAAAAARGRPDHRAQTASRPGGAPDVTREGVAAVVNRGAST